MPRPPMSGCGPRPGPQAGRWPTWPASCWLVCRSPNEPIVQGGGTHTRTVAGIQEVLHITVPISRGMGRQQPTARTRRWGRRLVSEIVCGRFSYRRSRLSSTVPTTEAITENRIISRHPGQPPKGRIWTRPVLMRWLPFRGVDR
jgi:hypothetical protein